MADNLVIYKKCPNCEGDGTVLLNGALPGEQTEETCDVCNGEGKIFWGWMLEEEI